MRVPLAVLLMCCALPPVAWPQQLDKAGSVAALLPTTEILRGPSSAKPLAAAKGQEVAWNDVLRTDKDGRVRVALSDRSVVSLGAKSELRLLKPGPNSSRTTLELAYGLIRMQVVKLLPGQRLELHTPTAAAGVIGTDFGADASQPGVTRFVCIAGDVEISNVDPKVPGKVVCHGGSTVVVRAGRPPESPAPAAKKQMQRWKHITEPEAEPEVIPGAPSPY